MDMNRIDMAARLNSLFADFGKAFIRDARSGRCWTRGDFESAALCLASVLRDRVGGCDVPRIAVLCDNSPDVLVLYWAVLLIGGVVLPIDRQKGVDEVRKILEDTKPNILVCDEECSYVPASLQILRCDLVRMAETATPFGFHGYGSLDLERDYLVVFTSGSTDVAKGVVHSFGNLYRSAMSFSAEFGFSHDNTFFHNFPMSFMAGILNTFIMPLVSGSRLAVGDRQSVPAAFGFWRQVISCEADTFWFNPTFCNMLLKLDRSSLGVEYCAGRKIVACIGTAPLDDRTKEDFERRYGFELFESFGLSETLFISTNTPRFPRVAGSVGVLLDGAEVRIADDGELLVSAPWMLKQYVQKEFSCKIPFPTGDIGYVKDGNLFISGRKKDLIIKGGVNVSPRKIEKFLSSICPEMDMVAVVGCRDGLMGELTVCYFTGAQLTLDSQKRINGALRQSLGKDYVVDKFVHIQDMPLNHNGKIDKLALKAGTMEDGI